LRLSVPFQTIESENGLPYLKIEQSSIVAFSIEGYVFELAQPTVDTDGATGCCYRLK
jgi:hypothetical protein